MKRSALCLILLVLSGSSLSTGSDYAGIFGDYRDNIVAITYTLRPKESPRGGIGRKVEEAICGVIVDSSGLIVTSADPFPDPGGDPKTTLAPVEFRVHLRGGTELEAEAVGLDRNLNMAYLRLLSAPGNIRPLSFSQRELGVGEEVVVLGVMSKRYDYEPVFYTGFVNAALTSPRIMYSLDLHVQDLSIGGLVLSSTGEPIGIIGEDVLEQSPSNDRMPANILSIFGSFTQGRRVGYPMVFPYPIFAEQLSSPPPIAVDEKRSWLGIVMQPLNKDLIEYWKLKVDGGIIISSIVEGSPAQAAGLKPADIVVEIQGEPLSVTREEDLPEFRRRIERAGVGKELALAYLRNGDRTEISLKLGAAPASAWTADEDEDEDIGITVREITMDDVLAQNLEPDLRGVVVSELERAGWAQLGGVQVGDIIRAIDGNPVTDLASYKVQTSRLRDEKPAATLWFVLRRTETLFVSIKTTW